MTDKEKLEKLMKLADDMYYAAANLGANVGSGERLRKTMEEYHKFIIHEYNKEEPVSEDFETALEKKVREAQDWTYIEEEGGECPLNEEFGADDLEEFARWGADWVRNNKKEPVSKEIGVSYDDKINEAHRLGREEGMFLAQKMFKEPVNEELEKAAVEAFKQIVDSDKNSFLEIFKAGAKWQKQQMMKDAVECAVECDVYGMIVPKYAVKKAVDNTLAQVKDKVKVLIIKED